MIESLTKEQEAKFPKYVDKWTKIGLSTKPINKAKARKAVALAYKCAGLKPPKVLFCRSPFEAVKILTTKAGPDNPNGPDEPDMDPMSNMAFGFQDAEWLSFYDFFRRECGLKNETDPLKGLFACADIGWWSPYEHVALVQDRPKAIHMLDGQLHKHNGKAVEYRDGTGIYAWRGRVIPATHAFIFDAPQTITAQMIKDEKNAEYRRIMMAVFGVGRFVQESGAEVRDRSDYGTLYSLRDASGDICMVELDNSTPEPDGTRKKYLIPVPANMRTAHEAVAWKFRRTTETYAPEHQS